MWQNSYIYIYILYETVWTLVHTHYLELRIITYFKYKKRIGNEFLTSLFWNDQRSKRDNNILLTLYSHRICTNITLCFPLAATIRMTCATCAIDSLSKSKLSKIIECQKSSTRSSCFHSNIVWLSTKLTFFLSSIPSNIYRIYFLAYYILK